MKNYLVSNNKNFILGYEIKEELIKVTFSNGKIKYIPNSELAINYLDDVMKEQHELYKKAPDVFIDKKSIICSSIISAIIASSLLLDETEDNTDIYLTTAVVTGLSFLASTLIIGVNKKEEAYRDFEKDELMLKYQELLEKTCSDEEFYNKLPKKLKSKVTDIHTGKDHLCINSINDFTLSEIQNLVLKSINYDEKPKKLIRK
ncbi:MAG: hypothetical protein ACI4PE_01620 [Bacilli bacterium]